MRMDWKHMTPSVPVWPKALLVAAGMFTIAVFAWDEWRDRQVIDVQVLGLAKDLEWLGTNDGHWLVRASTGEVLTLAMDAPVNGSGLAMAPDARLLRKTAASGKRWVCDVTLQHCIRTAGVRRSLEGDARS